MVRTGVADRSPCSLDPSSIDDGSPVEDGLGVGADDVQPEEVRLATVLDRALPVHAGVELALDPGAELLQLLRGDRVCCLPALTGGAATRLTVIVAWVIATRRPGKSGWVTCQLRASNP